MKSIVSIAIVTLVLNVAGWAQTYVSQTTGNDATGNGTQALPYKSIAKAVTILSETGGTISIEAGNYSAALTGDTAAVHITTGKIFTFIGTAAGANTTVAIENGFWLDHADAVVTMGVSGTANFNLGSTVTALKLSQGRMTIAPGTATGGVTLGSGATMTITNGIVNTRPATGENLSIVCDGGNVDASWLTAALGTGVITFAGGSNQTITVPSGGASIGSMTINKASGSNTVSIAGGSLTCTGQVTFINGLILTDTANALVLTNTLRSTSNGFVRRTAQNGKSHVVGNVTLNVRSSPAIAFARNEFPVGDMENYRPAALTFFTPGVPDANMGINVTISHSNTKPIGKTGFPIADGIASGVYLFRFPSFYWSIKTDSVIEDVRFNLELTAAGFDPMEFGLADVGGNQVKLIRRMGIPTDIGNAWSLQGNSSSYDNIVVDGVPTVTAVNATGGLSPSGAIFTYGLRFWTDPPPILPVTLMMGGQAFRRALNSPPVFAGSVGPVEYTVKSTNPSVAAAAISGDTLIITPLAVGKATMTLTGVDNAGFVSTNFVVTVNPLTVSLAGRVVYDNPVANGIGGATVTLMPATGTAIVSTADSAGNFTLTGVQTGTYLLTASKTGRWAGANATDGLKAVRIFAGLETLDALASAAADVNNSSSVNATDGLLIVQRFVGTVTSFAKGDWTFETKSVTVGTTNLTGQTIKGLAVGDVNKSDVPAGSNF